MGFSRFSSVEPNTLWRYVCPSKVARNEFRTTVEKGIRVDVPACYIIEVQRFFFFLFFQNIVYISIDNGNDFLRKSFFRANVALKHILCTRIYIYKYMYQKIVCWTTSDK